MVINSGGRHDANDADTVVGRRGTLRPTENDHEDNRPDR
jgi:hypothetical protein